MRTSTGLAGEVIDYDIIKQEVTVETQDSRRQKVKADEIVSERSKEGTALSKQESEDESE